MRLDRHRRQSRCPDRAAHHLPSQRPIAEPASGHHRKRRHWRGLLHRQPLSGLLPTALFPLRLRSELDQGRGLGCRRPSGLTRSVRGRRRRPGRHRHRPADRRRPLHLDHDRRAAPHPLHRTDRQRAAGGGGGGHPDLRGRAARGPVLERRELRSRQRPALVRLELRRRTGIDRRRPISLLRRRRHLSPGAHRDRRARRAEPRHARDHGAPERGLPLHRDPRRLQPARRRAWGAVGRTDLRTRDRPESAGPELGRLRLAGLGRRRLRSRPGGLRHPRCPDE